MLPVDLNELSYEPKDVLLLQAKATYYSAMRIGEKLKKCYEPPRELPPQTLGLLKQLEVRREQQRQVQ
jgi:hypothetical protein